MHWVDAIYFPELVNRLADLDRRLRALGEACDRSPDADGLGILDDVENVIGEGFFHCQHYMIHRKGTVRNAYSCGTRFCSHTFAQVINAAANYWKHIGEWPDELALAPREKRTLDVIRDAGVTHPEYRLSNLLYELHPNRRLPRLLPRLVDWRKAMDRREQTHSALANG